jgi:formylmethanofuran dehydrogenase subunit E
MLITFKSKAGADVLMLGDAGKQLLALLDKHCNDAQGIFTAEQIPGAITRLESMIEAERAQQNTKSADEREAEEEAEAEAGRTGMAAVVNLAQRAWPLLDLLRCSLAAGEPVIWEAR